ncbi:glutathione S-transferase [Brasilonema octagenarum UFV-E1]|uniref:Glutathione S-transferase n=1 Tax=Brasilonema sennae CENA114 TaxID=415709 RepID=A0A856M9W9_9CYAN|nr:glutathione S-transferase family protein [Brasilonema sennae]QDL07548.1 glutathione S-transferase [Brasilonema sennae CENA114]QDL13910.1 glutathione S-transferase [Brasilonema octagenarum UFV-E1]
MTNLRPILRYFDDGKGRAELPRLIFIYGSVLFEDRTVSFEEYGRMRESGELAFDQLPTLEVGNTIIGQSCAIARYAAKQAGLYPLDSVQAAISDMVVDAWRDLLDLLYGCYVDRIVQNNRLIMKMRDASVKVERLCEYFAVTVPMHFKRFEQMIGSNQGSPFLVGPSLTWADLAVFDILSTLDETAKLWTTPSFFYIPEPHGPLRPPKELLKPYPKLNALHLIISKTPSIAAWLQTHSY